MVGKTKSFWACHNSKKKDRMNIDRSFLPHQEGSISATFTNDWYRRKGESQDKMGAKESDRCDLCKALQIVEGRFTTDDNSVPRPSDTYNMNARHFPKYTHSHTTGAGAAFTQS